MYEVVHVEALADEAPGVGHHEAEVRTHELVHRALGDAPATREGAAGALVGPPGAEGTGHAVEHRAFEALRREVGRKAEAAATATLARCLVGCDLAGQRAVGCTVEHPGELLDARRRIGLVFRVAHEARRQDTARPELGREGAKRDRGVRRPEQRVKRLTLSALDALRELDLFFVRQHATASASRRQGRRVHDGSGSRIVGGSRDGTVGKGLELEGLCAAGTRRGDPEG